MRRSHRCRSKEGQIKDLPVSSVPLFVCHIGFMLFLWLCLIDKSMVCMRDHMIQDRTARNGASYLSYLFCLFPLKFPIFKLVTIG